MKKINIDNKKNLTLQQLRQIVFEKTTLSLSSSAKRAIKKSAAFIQKKLDAGEKIYGVNTGFGKLSALAISTDQLQQLQKNLVLSSAVGTGTLLSPDTVKLILALKINSLAKGFSGIRLVSCEYLLDFFNHQYLPCIPAKGSVGASGDLAPLAHMVLPLLGQGEVQHGKKIIGGSKALQQLTLPPLQLQAKEGLALLNGTQVSTAIALANYFLLERIFNAAILAGTLSTVAIGGNPDAFHPLIHRVRNQPAQIKIASLYHQLLKFSDHSIAQERVQDPYSIRCQPQVMGACWQQMQDAAAVLHQEANGVSDNPLIFVDENKILSGGNFHAEPIAMAADNLALVIAEIANISERRIALLIDSHMSGLPPFLVNNAGVNSGFMIAQVTAAALASENKTLAHPASVDNIPTSANQEDHVSMATFAARRLEEMLHNTATVVAVELLAACQGIDLSQSKLKGALKEIYDRVRTQSDFYQKDRSLAKDIAKLKEFILAGACTQFKSMTSFES